MLFITEVESDTVIGEHWMILDGLIVGTMATRDEALATLAAMVTELQKLPSPVYVLAHGYMTLDEMLPLSKAVERAERVFDSPPLAQAQEALAA